MPEKARQNGDPLAVLFLILLAALPYLNTLANTFVYDDRQQVLENPYIHSFRYLGRIFGSTVWTFEGAQGATNYYRPLMTFAYLLAYKAFGLIPFGFHLMNLALHIAVVLLVFAVAERLFRDRLLSLVAAGLFALHPIHTESVAWIAGITDLELSVFFLLTFLLYLRLARIGIQRRAILALLYSNPDRLSLLPSFQGASAGPARSADRLRTFLSSRRRAKSHFLEKFRRYLPLCLAAAAYLVFRRFVLGGFAPAIWRPAMPWSSVLLSAVALIGGYLWKLLWPAHLMAFYVFHESNSIRDPRVLGGHRRTWFCAPAYSFGCGAMRAPSRSRCSGWAQRSRLC